MNTSMHATSVARDLFSRLPRVQAGERRILIFLDFDGTLVELGSDPELTELSSERKERLKRIFSSERFLGVVASGRGREFLSSRLSGVSVVLAAEHGSFFRLAADTPWIELTTGSLSAELDRFQAIMEDAAAGLPGTFVERKERSVVFHYRMSDPPLVEAPEDLVEVLRAELSPELRLSLGLKIIEIRPNAVSKGSVTEFAAKLLGRETDSMVGMGDDETDEDLFAALRRLGHFSVCVGERPSLAEFRIEGPEDTYVFLEELRRMADEEHERSET